MKSMKSIFYTALGYILMLSISYAEMHTFTNSSGSTIEAELVKHKDGKVTLKRADGKEFDVKPEIFSTADQKFISEWMTKTPEYVDYRFRVSGDKKKISGGTGSAEWAYKISITNSSQDTVKDLHFDYRVFHKHEDQSPSMAEGTQYLEANLDFNRTLEITTRSVTLGNWEGWEGEIVGCILRVRDKAGNQILEWTSSELAMKDKTWANTTPKCDDENAGSAVIK